VAANHRMHLEGYGLQTVRWSFYICPSFAGLLIQGRITFTCCFAEYCSHRQGCSGCGIKFVNALGLYCPFWRRKASLGERMPADRGS